ncbi:MAG: DUF2171 domain-containing protein [Actinobacteria bacterium]|nr:DUF2171 domain-containing protein [Actinomycetota bacterium]
MADPVSWLVIERGWKVLAADGTEVGSVDELIGDTGKDIFNGLSVSTGLLKRSRYVPSERVIAILEGVVQLDLAAHQIDRLDEHGDQPPSAEIRPG